MFVGWGGDGSPSVHGIISGWQIKYEHFFYGFLSMLFFFGYKTFFKGKWKWEGVGWGYREIPHIFVCVFKSALFVVIF